MALPERQGLYDPRNEHDSCGIGFVANIKGRKSHDIITRGLQILVNLDHRGAVGADPLVGDGAGCLIQMPDALLRDWATRQGLTLPEPGRYAVAMCFLPWDERARAIAIEHVEGFIRAEGQTLIGWRDVPTDTTGLGARVIETMPWISQAIVACSPEIADQDAFERKILTIRKQALNSVVAHGRVPRDAGVARPLHAVLLDPHPRLQGPAAWRPQVGSFYEDLRNPLTVSALALVHQRFSTNTFPSWRLAHPYRFLCHNGEINTVRGNVNWMAARRQAMTSELLGRRSGKDGAADRAGTIRHRLHRQCARAARHRRRLFARPFDDDADPRGLGRQPADGPAAAGVLRIPCRADGAVGRAGGDRLYRRPPDRRDARPQRPAAGALHRHRRRSRDHGVGGRRTAGAGGEDHAQVAAAAGQDAADRPRRGPHRRRRRDQAQTRRRASIRRHGSKRPSSSFRNCRIWPRSTGRSSSRATVPARPNDPTTHLKQQQAFGYTQEDIQFFLEPMARDADDPVGSMGTDTPIAALSNKPKLLYNYFKQNFAQVTNPPIDPIREAIGDVAGLDDRAAAEPVGARGRLALPARSVAADPDRRRPQKDPRDRESGQRFPHRYARCDLAGGRGCRRHGAGARAAVPRGDRGGGSRATTS